MAENRYYPLERYLIGINEGPAKAAMATVQFMRRREHPAQPAGRIVKDYVLMPDPYHTAIS